MGQKSRAMSFFNCLLESTIVLLCSGHFRLCLGNTRPSGRIYLEGPHDGHEDEEGESKDVEDPDAPDFPLLPVRQEALAPLAAPSTTPHPTPPRCHCSRGASIIHMACFRCEDGRALRVSSSLGARHRLAEHSAGIDPTQLGPSHLITSSHSRPPSRHRVSKCCF